MGWRFFYAIKKADTSPAGLLLVYETDCTLTQTYNFFLKHFAFKVIFLLLG